MKRILIDTDFGLDADDAFTIALAALSPDIEIMGISTCFGDGIRQGQMCRQIVRTLNGQTVPVAAGMRHALLNKRDQSGDWQATDGFLSKAEQEEPIGDEHGIDLIIRKILEYPDEITLLCIGPLTNIAMAVLKEPSIATLTKEVVIMGGVHRLGTVNSDLPVVEYNIACDPFAAKIVLEAPWSTTLVTLDVTTKVLLTEEHVNLLRTSPNPLGKLLADMALRWWKYVGDTSSPMHDPLALASVLRPELVEFQKVKVMVDCESTIAKGQTIVDLRSEPSTQISMNVEADQFMEWFLQQLLLGKPGGKYNGKE